MEEPKQNGQTESSLGGGWDPRPNSTDSDNAINSVISKLETN